MGLADERRDLLGGVHIKKIWNKRYLVSINDGDYIDTLRRNNCMYCEKPEDKDYRVTQDQGIEEIINFCSSFPGLKIDKRHFTKRSFLKLNDDVFYPTEINISNIKVIELKIHYFEESKNNIKWVQDNLTADEFIEFCIDRGMRVLGIK